MEQALKRKISEAMLEEFVGNYIFTAEELNVLYSEVGNILNDVATEWGAEISILHYDIIFVSLVNLVKEWDSSNSALLEFIYRKLVVPEASKQKVYRQITKILNYYDENNQIFVLNATGKKYYATLCSHALAPLYSIEAFFDLCWEIYCEDLYQDYQTDDYLCKLLTENLQSRFLNDSHLEDDFQIGSKVYALRVGIKALALDNPIVLTRLIDSILQDMHALFHSMPIQFNKYIHYLVKNWWVKKEEFFGIKRKSYSKIENVVTNYAQIKAKYILENGKLKLYIPSIRLQNNLEYTPWIEVYIHEECIISEELFLKGSGILLTTASYTFDLEKIDSLQDIAVKITQCDSILYDSKQVLHRNFILFKDEKEIIADECIPTLYQLYTTNPLQSFNQYPKDCKRIGHNLYSLNALEGDILQSDTRTVLFMYEKSNKEMYFFAREQTQVHYSLQNETYKIIEGELYIDVNTDINIQNYGVRFKETSFPLQEFKYQTIGNKKRFLLSAPINSGESQKVSIFKYGDNSICATIRFIKFDNLQLLFDKTLYYGEKSTGTLSLKIDNDKIIKKFYIQEEKIAITYKSGELVVHLPIVKWKIDDGKWNYGSVNAIWYKSFTNSSILQIEVPQNMSCFLGTDKNEFIKQIGNSLQFKLGEKMYTYSNANEIKKTSVFANIDNKYTHLTEIYLQECFIDEPIYVFPSNFELFWFPEKFIGNIHTEFKIKFFNENNNCCKELQLKSNNQQQKFELNMLQEGYYTVRVYTVGQGFFKKEKEVFSSNIVLGNEKELRFKKKYLKINAAMLFNESRTIQIRPIYIENIQYLGNQDETDYYSGMLYIKVVAKKGKKVYLNTMRNEEGEYITINPVRIVFKDNASCYLAYGLDISDEDFDFEGEFTLGNDGKINIVAKLNGQKLKFIDYFLLEVKDV